MNLWEATAKITPAEPTTQPQATPTGELVKELVTEIKKAMAPEPINVDEGLDTTPMFTEPETEPTEPTEPEEVITE